MAMLIVMAPVVYGQAGGPLNERFDAGIRAVVPEAELDSGPGPARGAENYRRWRYSGGTVTVRYSLHPSAKAAEQFLERAMEVLPIPTIKLEGFGDGAFLVAPTRGAERRLNFRRGRIVVEVAAPGEENVRRFAAVFLAEVNRAIRAGQIEER